MTDLVSERAPDDLEWTPVRPGGAAFGTHRLVTQADRLEFRPSGRAKALVGVIGFAGVATMIGGAIFHHQTGDVGALVVGVVMLVPSAVLVWLLRGLLFNYRVFDRKLGLYWDTREGGDRRRPGPRALALADVRGLQIIRERVIGPESDYDADELDLVLVAGPRINVIDHGDAAGLRRDAEQIAAWLGRPLWVRSETT